MGKTKTFYAFILPIAMQQSLRAFPLFFKSQKSSTLLFLDAFRTESRYAVFLEMLWHHATSNLTPWASGSVRP